MANANVNAFEGLYELAYKHGSFYDFETELALNRNDQVQVKEPVGKATQFAIQSGRLLYVRDADKQAPNAKKVEGK